MDSQLKIQLCELVAKQYKINAIIISKENKKTLHKGKSLMNIDIQGIGGNIKVNFQLC